MLYVMYEFIAICETSSNWVRFSQTKPDLTHYVLVGLPPKVAPPEWLSFPP